MRIALVTSLEGKGLQVDAELVQGLLQTWGHEAELIAYDQPWPGGEFDLGICFEVVVPNLFAQIPRWFWFPNCEWLKPEMVKPAQKFDLILAKTRAAETSLLQSFPNVVYTGFLTRDQYDGTVAREKRFLHIGGAGGYRNTPAVIAAWREYRYWNGTEAESAELTIVSRSTTVTFEETPGITFIKRATDEEIKRLQNSHLFHLYPSAAEGWGHALHEAEGVGAILLTADAAPMNEIDAPFFIPATKIRQENLATLYSVNPAHIREAVPKMMAQTQVEIETRQWAARDRFEMGNAEFTKLFWPLLAAPVPTSKTKPCKYGDVTCPCQDGDPCHYEGENPMTPPRKEARTQKARIALLGNFGPPHSTENDLAWTLRDMGHDLLKFQENKVMTEQILEDCKQWGVDLLCFVHTHGWNTPGVMSLDELWQQLRRHGVKTCSFHLDKYWGLNQNDHREDLIGRHAFWKTDAVFTADGADHPWPKRLVNHYWLPPGVVGRDCIPGQYRDDLAVDVGFVGARSYHPEYPFRGELISFLEQTYGDRFRIFSGFRGQVLNDLYASMKICVGDCCFSGEPNYWSDRLPEACGRGAFLLHPQIEGMCIPTATYVPRSLDDLRQKIDYYLEHDEERELIRKAAHKHVAEHDTYHNRMKALLEITGVS